MAKDIPVYLFTGFLGSGKTEFIQETLENYEFGKDGRTLLLVCEEGEIEYQPEKFQGQPVSVEYIDKASLNEKGIKAAARKNKFDRVVIEYNGMWMLEDLWAALPESWVIAQEMCFFDANTFMVYNQNMRQQCFDKMKTADMVVFNRFDKSANKMPFHKEVRIANRKCMIIYEYGPDDMEIDDIEDPLPYDINQKNIEIKDDWYAEWYTDINENEKRYDGKVLTLRGRVAINKDLPGGRFAFGRHVMTCCAADVQFAALMAIWNDTSELNVGDWVRITAKVRIEYEEAYGEKGPVLYVKSLEKCEPADPEVASF